MSRVWSSLVAAVAISGAAVAQPVPFVELGPAGFRAFDDRALVRVSAEGLELELRDRSGHPQRLRWGIEGQRRWEVLGGAGSAVDVVLAEGRGPARRLRGFETLEVALEDGVSRLWLAPRTRGVEYGLYLASPEVLRDLRFFHQGVQDGVLTADGQLRLQLPGGALYESAPRCSQGVGAARRALRCEFVDLRQRAPGRLSYGISAPLADPSAPLEIDPTLSWSKYLGGELHTVEAVAAAPDGGGAVYAGIIRGVDGGGADDDVIVGWVRADGGHQRIAVLRGSAADQPLDVAAAGQWVAVVGVTDSTDFPALGTFGPTNHGGTEGFVALIDGQGQVQAAYVGSVGEDVLSSAAFSPSGDRLYVGGWTSDVLEGNGPSGVFTTSTRGAVDGTLTCLQSSSFSRIWQTQLGGIGDDEVSSLHVDATGALFAAGRSESSSFAATSSQRGASWPWLVQVDQQLGTFNAADVFFLEASGAARGVRAVDGEGDAVFLAGTMTVGPGAFVDAGRPDGGAYFRIAGEGVFLARTEPAAGTARRARWVELFNTDGGDRLTDLSVDPYGGPLLLGDSTSADGLPARGRYAPSGASFSGQGFLIQLDAAGGLRHAGRLGGPVDRSTGAMGPTGELWLGLDWIDVQDSVPAPTLGGPLPPYPNWGMLWLVQVDVSPPATAFTPNSGYSAQAHPLNVPLAAALRVTEPESGLFAVRTWFERQGDASGTRYGEQVTVLDGGEKLFTAQLVLEPGPFVSNQLWYAYAQAWNVDGYDRYGLDLAQARQGFITTVADPLYDGGRPWVDAGAPVDAGAVDAGAETGDAGVTDAGTDAGQPEPDGGTSPDAGAPSGPTDAGTQPEAKGLSPIGFSCGCEGAAGNPWLAAVLLLGALLRRRSQRSLSGT